MSAPALPPTPSTTLVVLLGASAWPNSPKLEAEEAFMHAAQEFKDYLLDPHGFGLPRGNLLDQFDEQAGVSDQLERLGTFLDQQAQALATVNQAVRDVLVYFVGHGSFVGPSSYFYLLLRRTYENRLHSSGMSIEALAETLRECARQTRRYLFLDCCFAAAAFRAFQGGPDQTAIAKTLDAFDVQTRRGTALLCSSDRNTPSLRLPNESSTMFSAALLDVLKEGDSQYPLYLSLHNLYDLTLDRLITSHRNAVRPILYSPDQIGGDVAHIPFFPNLAHKQAEQPCLCCNQLCAHPLVCCGTCRAFLMALDQQATIGQLIKKYRRGKKWTQEKLAKRIEVGKKTVSRWERGEVEPSSENLRRLMLTLAEREQISSESAGSSGQRIKTCRTGKGWTQEELANRIGANPKTVSFWEKNYNRPSLEYLRQLMIVFERSTNESHKSVQTKTTTSADEILT